MFSFITSKIVIAAIVAFAVLLGGFYWYYKSSQATIAELQANNAQLTIAVQTNEATIAKLEADNEFQIVLNKQLQDSFNASRRAVSILSARIKDIESTATTDPGATDDLVNSTIRTLNNCFEILSGTPADQLSMTSEVYNETKAYCLGN